MNGRMYDANLGRFLSPDNFIQDPYNTQSFNRYGYVWNNPLKYGDPSGEFLITALIVGAVLGAATGAAAYVGSALRTGNWNWGHFAASVIGGAIVGALSSGQLPALITTGYALGAVAGGFVAGLLPSANIEIGDFSFGISPAIAFGGGFSIGASFNVGYRSEDFSFSASVTAGHTSGVNDLNGVAKGITKGGFANIGGGINYDDGKTGFGYHGQYYSSPKQYVGGISFRSGRFGARFEDDFPFGDQHDRFRTAGLQLSWQANKNVQLKAGFSIFTGQPDKSSYDKSTNSYKSETPFPYRNGLLYGDVNNRGTDYLGGRNSEKLQHFFQNNFHDAMGKPPLKTFFKKGSPHFPAYGFAPQNYFRIGTNDRYGLPYY